jgi:hypothetical protein
MEMYSGTFGLRLRSVTEYLKRSFLSLLSLFSLMKKVTKKNQGKRPTPICPEGPSQNGGSPSFAKINRTITNVCSGVYDKTKPS